MTIYASDVLKMLIPNGGWTTQGEDFESIQFLECEPITKAQFEAGFSEFETWKNEQNNKVIAAKEVAQAKLAALGLTTEDLKALGL